jgi:hypothetical protein
MQPYQQVLTFTNGTAVSLSITDFSGNAISACAKMLVEPDDANTHEMYVGDARMALGTSVSNHVIRIIAPPPSPQATSTAGRDNFQLETQRENNTIFLASFTFDGTTGEKVRVTAFVN